MTKREPITWQMKQDALLFRYAIKCGICGCDIHPGQEIEWDHIHALCHDGPHVFTNLRPVHADPCHKRKTKADVQAKAKVARILADKPSSHPMQNSGRPIPSRPFPPAGSRPMRRAGA